MKHWFVAHTQSKQEALAQQHLQEQGFNVFLPLCQKTRRHARKLTQVTVPLFARYIFVEVDLEHDPWRSINGTRGVEYILGNNETPTAVPHFIVDELKAQQELHGVVPVASLNRFVKGEKVRVLEGIFKDYEAIFDDLDEKQRVQILLTFLGRKTRVSVPNYAVEAA